MGLPSALDPTLPVMEAGQRLLRSLELERSVRGAGRSGKRGKRAGRSPARSGSRRFSPHAPDAGPEDKDETHG
jgi:hypothetical protein